MDPTALLKILTDEESLLEKKRTRKLATSQWADVIAVEAQIALCKNLRDKIVKATIEKPLMP